MSVSGKGSFAVGTGWKGILAQVGVDVVDVLRRARLPEDLLNGGDVRVSSDDFLRIHEAIHDSVQDPTFWVRLTEGISPEWFTPAIFASLCSPNLATAAQRFARFKPLLGPISLEVDDAVEGLRLTYRWEPTEVRLPAHVHVVEAMFITQLARLGTRQPIQPIEVTVPELPAVPEPYEGFLGVELRHGDDLRVRFAREDAHRAFLSSNPAMWDIFEPELSQRLADLEEEASFTRRAQAVLLEGLPSGQFSMDEVARRLGVSTRTLQRRLQVEGTRFKAVVGDTRQRSACHYLRETHISLTEVAYLLGFEEPNSFFRAFHRWTGTTPEQFRAAGAPSASRAER